MSDKAHNPYRPGSKAYSQWREGYMLGLKGIRRSGLTWLQSAEYKVGHESGMRVYHSLPNPYEPGTKSDDQWRKGYRLGLSGKPRTTMLFLDAISHRPIARGQDAGYAIYLGLASPTPRVAD